MATCRVAPQLHPALFSRMEQARARTDSIFELLAPNSLYERPVPERNRLIFYLGHVEAFDWTLLSPALGLESWDADLDRLFSFGLGMPKDAPSDWPAVEQAEQYNRRARETLDAALCGPRATRCEDSDLKSGALLHVAIEHRLMHAETLGYLLHNLPQERKIAPSCPIPDRHPAPKPRQVTIPTGAATLGQARGAAFGWDNEFEQQKIEVPSFSIGAFPVTNGDYLKFVAAGGYVDSNYWTPESWEWKSSAKFEHPHFWARRPGASHGTPEDRWDYRTMFGRIPLPLSWPVYVSHAEASAYARWTRRKLPSEAQWHRAAYGTPEGEQEYPWGDDPPDATRGNFDCASWDPVPVDAHPAGASAFGVFDLLGNGWEWTSTPFGPLPGFRMAPYYPGYSANFFDGKFFVLKGGSPQTDACMLRPSFRNWFQPHYRYLYATFRCVED